MVGIESTEVFKNYTLLDCRKTSHRDDSRILKISRNRRNIMPNNNILI